MKALFQPFPKFFQLQSASSVLLLFAMLLALGWANFPWHNFYAQIWQIHWILEPIHFWINECLMTIFFFVVGLEIKRELFNGEQSTPQKACLPMMAAVGGMIFPALIYFLIAGAKNPSGWGIPTVTDIAFTLGTLAILGNRVPVGLKVF